MKVIIIFTFVALASAQSYGGSGSATHARNASVSITPPLIPMIRENQGSPYGNHEVIRQSYGNSAPAMRLQAPASPYSHYNNQQKPKAALRHMDQPAIRIHYGLPESANHAPVPVRAAHQHVPAMPQRNAALNGRKAYGFESVKTLSAAELSKDNSEASATRIDSSVSESAPESAPFIPTLRFDEEIKEGSYVAFDFEAANGIHQKDNTSIEYLPEREETRSEGSNYGSYGADKYDYEGEGRALITKTGSFSYISPEGQRIELSYVADKDGYRPVGTHLPTSPPLPEANVRAAAAHLAEVARVRALEEAAKRAEQARYELAIKNAAEVSNRGYGEAEVHSGRVSLFSAGY